MPRASSEQLQRLAVDALAAAAEEAGARLERIEGATGADLVLRETAGRGFAVEVRSASAPSADSVRGLGPRMAQDDRIHVLVADRLFQPAREAADELGWSWLDRRGHLRLVGPGLYVDTDVEPMDRRGAASAKGPIAGRSGISLALALLMEPADPPGVREVARRSDLSPSAISQARQRLDEASLLEADGRPLVPELFWELVDVWATTVERFPVARRPGPTDPADHLELRSEEPKLPGWALGGATAAIEWGAPLLQGGAATIDLYVPSEVVLRRARRLLGDGAETTGPAARLAVAPSRLVVAPRYEGLGGSEPYPLVHPVVAALDLALDPSRGREALQEWAPSGEFTRVW